MRCFENDISINVLAVPEIVRESHVTSTRYNKSRPFFPLRISCHANDIIIIIMMHLVW
jgi:hypothetical protein